MAINPNEVKFAVSRDLSDGAERNSSEGARYSVGLTGAHGEEEFVVVAAVQGEIEGIDILDAAPLWLARGGNS